MNNILRALKMLNEEKSKKISHKKLTEERVSSDESWKRIYFNASDSRINNFQKRLTHLFLNKPVMFNIKKSDSNIETIDSGKITDISFDSDANIIVTLEPSDTYSRVYKEVELFEFVMRIKETTEENIDRLYSLDSSSYNKLYLSSDKDLLFWKKVARNKYDTNNKNKVLAKELLYKEVLRIKNSVNKNSIDLKNKVDFSDAAQDDSNLSMEDWMKKHITRITGIIPEPLTNDFILNYGNEPLDKGYVNNDKPFYSDDKQKGVYSYSFKVSFDVDVKDIPFSNIRNMSNIYGDRPNQDRRSIANNDLVKQLFKLGFDFGPNPYRKQR